ncbi:MAG TPA: hypothetical protein VJ719_07920 [Chthoniobacterales bacterium]|nr:hypothetical protein [Chthoniobacterales bacterium]
MTKLFMAKHHVTARLIMAALIGVTGQACLYAQDAVRTLERTYEFDEAGNADVIFNFQLGAAQWAKWKDQYGDHPDLMLRNVKYEMAAAVIDDFSLEKNDVHRKATAKIKARAMAKYRGDGKFEIQVPKNMKLVSGSGREWAFTSSALEEGGIVNITDRAKLPSKAQNAHLTTGNDYDLLVYSLDVSPSKPKTFLYLGILSLLAAGGVGAMAFRKPA